MLSRNDLSSVLRDKGFRITPQREKILDIFLTLPEGQHLSAEDLQNTLRKDASDISLATSYRTLKLLASLGVLREVAFGDDHKQYELSRDAEGIEHHHIICIDCGSTEEFTSENIFRAAIQAAEEHHYQLIDAQFKIIGRCRSCALKPDTDL